MRGRKNPNDYPGIWSNQLPPLSSTQKEMKIGREELIQILLSHFGKRLCLVPIGIKAIPVECANLPIKDLKLAFPADRVYEPI